MGNYDREVEFVVVRYYPNGRVSFITARDEMDRAKRVVAKLQEKNPNAEYQIHKRIS